MTDKPKRRGGQGQHHPRGEPMIRPDDVDATIGPDAAELSPAERFARFVGAIMGRGKAGTSKRLPEPPCSP